MRQRHFFGSSRPAGDRYVGRLVEKVDWRVLTVYHFLTLHDAHVRHGAAYRRSAGKWFFDLLSGGWGVAFQCKLKWLKCSFPRQKNVEIPKFWENTSIIAYFPLVLHGPNKKDAFNYPSLPRERLYGLVMGYAHGPTDKAHSIVLLLRVFVAAGTCLVNCCLATIGRINIQTCRLMGGIYEVHHWNGFRCHNIHTEFHNDLLRHSKVNMGDL
jgi:hypothetical protein